MIDPQSLKVWLNQVAPTLSKRQIQVLEIFEYDPNNDFTNEEIAHALEWGINRVTGRTQELRGEGARRGQTPLIELSRVRECHITHNQAKAWKLRFEGVPVRPSRPVPEVYQVLSKTEPGRAYIIRESGAGITCPCKGFYFNRTCSHIDKLRSAPPKPEEVHTSLFALNP